MKKKILYLLFGYIFVLLFSAVSCIGNCGRGGPMPDMAKISSIELRISDATYWYDSLPKRWEFTPIKNGTVLYKNYAINVFPFESGFFSKNNNGLSLLNKSFACSPSELPHTDEILQNIKITCNKDFDGMHPAGSDLNQLFDIFVLDDWDYKFEKKSNISDYLLSKPKFRKLILILNSPPAYSIDYEFKVEFFVDGIDKDYYELSTEKIIISN